MRLTVFAKVSSFRVSIWMHWTTLDAAFLHCHSLPAQASPYGIIPFLPAGIVSRDTRPQRHSFLNELLSILFPCCPKVYVCYDKRLTRLPVWLLYFEGTDWVVHTTEGPFGVWRKRYAKGQV